MDPSHDRPADQTAPAAGSTPSPDERDADGLAEAGAAPRSNADDEALDAESADEALGADEAAEFEGVTTFGEDDEEDDEAGRTREEGDLGELEEDAPRPRLLGTGSGGPRISAVPSDASKSTDSSLPVPNDPSGPGLAQATALSAYMSQLRHHAPITREEEHELATRWTEEGDVEAAKMLVLSNLRLVVKIAMEYRRAWTNTLDLIQEGNVGLMEAVQRFDPYQGVKLSSYAVYWIRAYILKYILDNMRSVRLGTTRASRKLFFRLNKEKRELERQGYEVEPRLLAERLDVSEQDVVDMEVRLARPDLSFDAPLRSDEGDGMTFGDRMEAAGLSSEDAVGGSELREVFLEQIRTFAETLSERDRQILDERVLAEEPRTLADLGEEFDVSRERVRQLEAKIIGRLREFMQENMVDFEYYGPDAG